MTGVTEINGSYENENTVSGNETTTVKSVAVYIQLPDEPARAVLYHVGLVFYYFLAGFGFFGNGATILVLARQGLSSTTNIFLSSLSVLDLLFTGSYLMKHCYFLYFSELKLKHLDLEIMEFSTVLTQCNSLYLTLNYHLVALISVERLLAVSLPLSLHKLNTPIRMKCIILLLIIYVGIINSFPNKYTVFYLNKIISTNAFSVFGLASAMTVQLVFQFYSLCLVSTIPLTVVLLCTSLTILKLLVSSKKFKSMSTSNLQQKTVKELKVVKLLSTVCVVFVVLVVPVTLVHTYCFLTFRMSPHVQLVCDILHQMMASVNFIIYVKMNAKFAAIFHRMWKNVEK